MKCSGFALFVLVVSGGLCLGAAGCRTTPRAEDGSTGQAPESSTSPPLLPHGELAQLTGGNARFGYRLARELASSNTGNVCVSPYSLGSAFGMLLGGARGATRDQLRATLCFDLPDEEVHAGFADLGRSLTAGVREGRFLTANSLWVAEGLELLPDFAALTERYYQAQAATVRFPDPGRDKINAWVSDRTEGQIPELLPQGCLSGDTRLVLVNALYVLVSWDTPFEETATRDEVFRSPGGSSPVPTMHATLSVLYSEGVVAGARCQAVVLPYKSRALEMAILLPDEGALPLATGGWDEKATGRLLDSAKTRDVAIALPKWKVDASYRLRGPLERMGLAAPFAPGADFTGLVRVPAEDRPAQPWLEEVFHATSVTVDEKGTEAAAATGIVTVESAELTPRKLVSFVADHPFLYLIRDTRSGQILMLGRLSNPAA